MNIPFLEQRKSEKQELMLKQAVGNLFREKQRSKPGYKSPIFAYSTPVEFYQKGEFGQNSRAKILKMKAASPKAIKQSS